MLTDFAGPFVSSLAPGDWIKLDSGFGWPQCQYDRTLKIVEVSPEGNKAVANDGTILNPAENGHFDILSHNA